MTTTCTPARLLLRLLALFACAATARAAAADLDVSPREVVFADAYDGRQLVVSQDGHDLTRAGRYTSTDYPVALRRIEFLDMERDRTLTFLTNNFQLPANRIALLYKSRWQVELFFKWIKQHLRIKAFFGIGENAVKTQIWIAVSVYVLVAVIRKRLHLEASLYQILQILSVTLFEKTPILQALQPPDSEEHLPSTANQLILFSL